MSELPEIPFEPFGKISRYNRNLVISEKIDGTNASVWINDEGAKAFAGSRTRWITPEDDNYGFARWVQTHHDELLALGPGHHFGEWWGAGIQRRYGLTEKRFSLFNSARWSAENPQPACCHVVPVLANGLASEVDVYAVLENLRVTGSVAAPGFMNPEGIVIYHVASRNLYKMTLERDHEPKGKGASNE